MKYLFIIIQFTISILIFPKNLPAQNSYNINSLLKSDGIYKSKNETEPANGLVYNLIKNKKVKMGNLINGKKHGRWIEWHPDERRLDENYKHGLLDGNISFYYKSGQREWRYTFKNDVLDGIHTKWYINGKKMKEGFFENGKSVGIWVWWDQNGNIIRKEKFPHRKKGAYNEHKEYKLVENIKGTFD